MIYLLFIIPGIVLGSIWVLYTYQEFLVFKPEKTSVSYQYRFKNDFREISFQMPDGNVLHGVHFKVKDSKGVIFYHHGNSGSIVSIGEKAIHFTKLGFEVIMYDYRGFGKSTGTINNEKMMHSDALFLYEKLVGPKYGIDPTNIILYGHSLGTGIASKLAISVPVKQLILEAPYYSFYDVAKFQYPILPAPFLLKYRFRNNKYVSQLKLPTCIFHGTQDVTIPYQSSVRLGAINSNIKVIIVEEAGHSNLYEFEEYQRTLCSFLNPAQQNAWVS